MSFIRITWYLLTTKYNIALSRLEYPPFALTRVIPLPNVSVNALHISCGHSVTIIAHFALSCSVDTFYNKVNRLQCCGIRNDRIQWKHPALKYTSTDNISNNIIYHNKCSYRNACTFCENNRHNFDTVHCTAIANRKTASDSGDHTSKQRT